MTITHLPPTYRTATRQVLVSTIRTQNSVYVLTHVLGQHTGTLHCVSGTFAGQFDEINFLKSHHQPGMIRAGDRLRLWCEYSTQPGFEHPAGMIYTTEVTCVTNDLG